MKRDGPIGIVGVGAMGGAIAECLLRKGHDVVVRDIVPERVEALSPLGAVPAASAFDAGRRASIVLTVVVDAEQTDAVLFGEGEDRGVVAAASTNTTIVMCSTVAPAYVAGLGERLRERGVALIDAPISGGPQRARDGTLSMMAAAPDDVLARVQHVLDAIASRLFRVGHRAGDGSAMKIVNNMLAGINLAAAAEALALADRLGMDLPLVCDVVNASSGGSWIFGDRMPRALARDYEPPKAATKILAKDMRLVLDVAAAAGCAATIAAAAHTAYEGALARGFGEADDAALVDYYRLISTSAGDRR
jgi:3-hydroxyisobutyrate dehydrogenase-like beta-hydroxyacid dehydrogenase